MVGRFIGLMRNYFRGAEDAGVALVGVTQNGNSGFYDAVDTALSRPGLPDITRVMHQLWLDRRDLRLAFQLDIAESRRAYSHWFVENAQAEEGIDDDSLSAAVALVGRREGRSGTTVSQFDVRRLSAPWQVEDPWRGPAHQADTYLSGCVQFGGAARLPRQMAILWERRADLQQAFALSNAEEVDNFIAWCLTDGIAGGHVAPELLDPEFLQELDSPVAMTGPRDDLPITRAVRMLYPRCEQRGAVAPFPGDRNSRVQVALWLLLVASGKFRWPAALLGRLREYAVAPITSLPVASAALPRLLLMLWEAREDLRAGFDPISETGRLNLLRWFLFLGMDEYGLTSNDLPAYLRDALSLSTADPNEELPLLHQLILLHRDDVGAAFDASTVEGRRGYLEWFSAHGATELSVMPSYPSAK
jgi:hypothetical protein